MNLQVGVGVWGVQGVQGVLGLRVMPVMHCRALGVGAYRIFELQMQDLGLSGFR